MKNWNIEELCKGGYDNLPDEYIGYIQKKYYEGARIERKFWHDDSTWMEVDIDQFFWKTFMYRIKQEKSQKLMTECQLSEWLAKGNGQYKLQHGTVCYASHNTACINDNKEVDQGILIRRWGSNEWLKPHLDIYEKDCGNK